jgi:peptide/nickel transport system substrate-binding protein
MSDDHTQGIEAANRGWTRRNFLASSGIGLAAVGAGIGLAGCSGSSSPAGASGSASASVTPKRGGTLRVGSNGGGSTDTLDPQAWGTTPDQLRIQQLFDPLVWAANDGTAQLVLATSITPNADGTQWTIKIPAGVTTHAGKAFTADDVLYSLQRIVTNKFPGLAVLGPVDFAASKVVDPTTLLLAYSKPFGVLIDSLSFPFFYMVPRGFDPKNPDGTGPFKYQSFTPGVQSTFVRNENYWRPGLPYLDKVVVIDVADEATQVSGLQSGQFDVINGLSAASVAALKGSGLTVNANKSGTWIPFTQNCSLKPFSDVRVRQAMRLIPDRQQMLEQVYGGYGFIGNDVFSPFDPSFPTDLPQRQQDIGQAKSLLKAAGYEGLSVDLYTDPAAAGEVQIAQVYATQAKAAGVNVTIKQQSVGDFYSKYYQKVAFAMDWGTNTLFLVNAAQLQIPTSYFNANHFNDPEYNSLYYTAIATVDPVKRKGYIQQMAHIDYDRGAYIVPVFTPDIEAYTSHVGGIKPSVTGVSPGNADFAHFFIS